MGYKKTDLCQLGEGCFGCCGNSYKSRKEIEEDLLKNQTEFEAIVEKGTIEELKEFRGRRYHRELRPAGICFNLIRIYDKDGKNGKMGCPLHPAICGEELREGHCDINHLCLAAKIFPSWDEEKQARFIEFLLEKKLDWYDYSIGMDSGSLLREFENKEKKN